MDELRQSRESRVRVRVEHAFGAMENGMGGLFLRSTGMARAKIGVGLMNLAHNLKRTGALSAGVMRG